MRRELEAQMACRGFERSQWVQWRQQIGHGTAIMAPRARKAAIDFL